MPGKNLALAAAAFLLSLSASFLPAQPPATTAQPPATTAQSPAATTAQPPATTAAHTFVVSGNQFLMDGKPYQIRSGSIHYPRIPRAYWRDRFQLARAMGLNTITTYVFWNVHEPTPGHFDFSGNLDLAAFLRQAQQAGLNVILRPGPYVCAEWDLGGYPSWLLKNPAVVLRSHDPRFLAAQDKWLARLSEVIKPFLIQNGGPIIGIQIENEHGSFDHDASFVELTRQAYLRHGIQTAFMYTADGPANVPYGSLPGIPAAINFGTGGAKKSFAELAQLRPNGPRMSGEYWAGWFDHWGEPHHTTNGQTEAAEYAWMIGQGYSVSMYMFDGGTSFGWMNGANTQHGDYEPDTTSYDYDAPVDEAGNPRAKFFLFRNAVEAATGKTLPPVPPAKLRKVYPIDPVRESASLWNNLPKPIESTHLLSMEDVGQSYGFILYRTQLGPTPTANLKIDGLHDFAQIYLNHALIGTLDRRLGQTTLLLPPIDKSTPLDILVENNGRINFTTALRAERKGIVGAVTVAGKAPAHWQIFPLPMDHTASLTFHTAPCTGPCFYRTTMHVNATGMHVNATGTHVNATGMHVNATGDTANSTPLDTYLDTRGIHHGFVWINAKPLGRAWSIGPQLALYTPGPWLRQGSNTIVFFDLRGDKTDKLASVTDPIWTAAKQRGK